MGGCLGMGGVSRKHTQTHRKCVTGLIKCFLKCRCFVFIACVPDALHGKLNHTPLFRFDVARKIFTQSKLHINALHISGYASGRAGARTWASLLGHRGVASALQRILNEERRVDERLTRLAESLNRAAVEPVPA